jgi:putative ABC transport system permease protein
MLRNYCLIAIRNLSRRAGYSAINVFGLGVGMAACLLIGLYVYDELKVDRFHENAERIVQIGVDSPMWGRGTITPFPLAALLANEVPGVERAVRINQATWRLERPGSDVESQQTVFLTEPAFLDVFTFPSVLGDAAALSSPDGLVLTETAAEVLFGDTNPIGQTVDVVPGFGPRHELTVRAVIRDVPAGSTLKFGAVAPLSLLPEAQRQEDGWNMSMFFTYALMDPGMTAEALERRLQEALVPHFESTPPEMFAVPLHTLYLSDLYNPDGFRGQARYLYIFGFAALFVLLIAGINYVNLATAQGLRRSREVGVRKAVGALRRQLTGQFLTENVLVCGLALGLAVTLAATALPAFNTLFDKQLSLLDHRPALVALALFVLTVGTLAGAYPALVLSRFEAVRALRQQGTTSAGAGWLRKSLVVVQFAASSALLIGTAVIHSQVSYMQTRDLGFDGEQLVSFNLNSGEAWNTAETIRARALAHPGVLQASVTTAIPTTFGMTLSFKPDAITTTPGDVDPEGRVHVRVARVDAHFIETLRLRLAAGRGFDPDLPSDASRGIIINQRTAHELGWTAEEAVGKPFRLGFGEVPMGEVIGVVEDFHIASLHGEIPPVGFQMFTSPNWSSGARVVARLAPDDIPGAMRHLESELKPFAEEGRVSYAFVDELFQALYAAEVRLGRIFTAFAALAILVACMGLFGLAAFAAQGRTKEIGIRKVLGASIGGIVGLLSKDFLTLVVVAFVIAAPLAWWGMNRWLEDFAYRIDIGPGLFLSTAIVALAVAFAAVAYHALRAAASDPVKALRSE